MLVLIDVGETTWLLPLSALSVVRTGGKTYISDAREQGAKMYEIKYTQQDIIAVVRHARDQRLASANLIDATKWGS